MPRPGWQAPRVTVSGRVLPWLLLVGLLVRVAALPLPGTLDVSVWKIWAFDASFTGVTGIYGVGGDPPERAVLRYDGRSTTVDYPPMALHVLAWTGHAYRALWPAFINGPRLTAAVKLPSLLADVALATCLYLCLARHGRLKALRSLMGYWWSPAVILNGAVLGYLDPLCAWPAVAAFLLADRGVWLAAGLVAAVATLTKVQAAVPLVALAAWALESGPAAIRRLSAGALIAAAVLLVPFVAAGAWPNLVQAVGSLAHHDMVSGNACNLWWLYTWIFRALYDLDLGVWGAFTQPVRILALSTVQELGHLSPKPLATALAGAAMAWALWRARRHRRAESFAPREPSMDLAMAAALAAFLVHAYFTLAPAVHENHLYLAVPFSIVAGFALLPYSRVALVLGIIQALNLFVFYGISDGIGWLPPRSATIVDTSVVLAAANVVAFGWHARLFAKLTQVRQHGVADA